MNFHQPMNHANQQQTYGYSVEKSVPHARRRNLHLLLHALIFGLDATRRIVPERLVETMLAAGVLIYAGVGIAGLFLGGNFLDYFVLDHDSVHGQHRGIFWVEVGVATTVSGVMLKIFYMFAARGNADDE